MIRRCLAALALAATTGSAALAGAGLWYVTPEQRGACGEECYAPPGAWIDDRSAAYTFGMSCGDVMSLGGPAMALPEPAFAMVEMLIDERSLDRFMVQNGLNDVYVTPLDAAAQPSGAIRAALASGGALELLGPRGLRIGFTLQGSRAAIELMERLCPS